MVSWPHFYQADKKYREAVVGMKPDPEKHAMYIDVSPVSYVVFENLLASCYIIKSCSVLIHFIGTIGNILLVS